MELSGSGVIVDNTTIGKNASNQIEVKDDAITTDKILDANVTLAKLDDDAKGRWVKQEVKDLSGDTSADFTSLSSKKKWLLMFDLIKTSGDGDSSATLRFNGLTTARYTNMMTRSTGVDYVTDNSALELGTLTHGSTLSYGMVGSIEILNPQGATGESVMVSGHISSNARFFHGGYYNNPSQETDINQITAIFSAAVTGKVSLYYWQEG